MSRTVCAFTGCPVDVPYPLFLCVRHWRQVPEIPRRRFNQLVRRFARKHDRSLAVELVTLKREIIANVNEVAA